MAICEIFNQLAPKPAALVLNQLGRGGYSVVHDGVLFSREGAEPVALKSVEYRGDDDEVELDLAVLTHEETMLRRLDRLSNGKSPSPRLIMVIRWEDFERGEGTDPKTPEATIIMQRLPSDLTKHLETQPNKRYSVQEALGITKNILYSLETLHQIAHTIHRDIKPNNISLAEDGTITFMDFGLSGPIGQFTSLVGSLNFMDADQFQGMVADELSDIYGVGMTLFYLLTGKLLTDLIKEKEEGDRNTVRNKLMYAVIRGEYHQMMLYALQQVGITRDAYPQFVDFLTVLTHPDRNKRFQTAHEGWMAAEKLLSQT